MLVDNIKSIIMKEKKEVLKQEPKPTLEKVESKEEKKADGVRVIVSHNG